MTGAQFGCYGRSLSALGSWHFSSSAVFTHNKFLVQRKLMNHNLRGGHYGAKTRIMHTRLIPRDERWARKKFLSILSPFSPIPHPVCLYVCLSFSACPSLCLSVRFLFFFLYECMIKCVCVCSHRLVGVVVCVCVNINFVYKMTTGNCIINVLLMARQKRGKRRLGGYINTNRLLDHCCLVFLSISWLLWKSRTYLGVLKMTESIFFWLLLSNLPISWLLFTSLSISLKIPYFFFCPVFRS